MITTCKHCARSRWHRARGLCDPCYRWHRDEYARLGSVRSPLTCACASPDPQPVGGMFDAVGATQCAHCYRPVAT